MVLFGRTNRHNCRTEQGPWAAGPVTITGAGCGSATIVDFAAVAAASFVVVSDTSITVDRPPGLTAGLST